MLRKGIFVHTLDERPAATKRVALNMKASPALRAKIDAAARESGLSIAQEVERRLLASIELDNQAGGSVEGDFVRTMQIVMHAVDRNLGVRWWKHDDGWQIVAASLLRYMDDYRPDPAPPEPDIDADVKAEYDARLKHWRDENVSALWERRQNLFNKRRAKRKPFTATDEEELRIISDKLRELSKQEPKPALQSSDLEAWERHQEWQRRVQRAKEAARAVHGVYAPDFDEAEHYLGA